MTLEMNEVEMEQRDYKECSVGKVEEKELEIKLKNNNKQKQLIVGLPCKMLLMIKTIIINKRL